MNAKMIEELNELTDAILGLVGDEFDEEAAIVDELAHQLKEELENLSEV